MKSRPRSKSASAAARRHPHSRRRLRLEPLEARTLFAGLLGGEPSPIGLNASYAGDGVAEAVVEGQIVTDRMPDRLAVLEGGGLLLAGPGGVRRVDAQGQPDLSFGDGGVLRDHHLTLDIAPLADGSFYTAASQQSWSPAADWRLDATVQLVLTRYDADGAVDASWGGPAIVSASAIPRSARLLVDPQGRVTVVGFEKLDPAQPAGDHRERLFAARYLADGSLDAAFGGGGGKVELATLEQQFPYDYPNIFLQDLRFAIDGSLLAAGRFGGNRSLFRVTADGAVDTALWDTMRAQFTVSNASDASIFGLRLQRDGAMVALFSDGLRRFDPNGSLDPTFGGSGLVETEALTGVWRFGHSMASSYSRMQSHGDVLAVDASDRILLAVLEPADVANPQAAVVRLTADGVLDLGFGSGGFAIREGRKSTGHSSSSLPVEGVSMVSVAADPMGRPLAVGFRDLESTKQVAVVTRFNADGLTDWSYGVAGDAANVPAAYAATAVASAVQVVSGDRERLLKLVRHDGRRLEETLSLQRFLADGSPDSSFGDGGRLNLGRPRIRWTKALGEFFVNPLPGGEIAVGVGAGEQIIVDAAGQVIRRVPSELASVLNSYISSQIGVIHPLADGRVVVLGNGTLRVDGVNQTTVFAARFELDGRLDASFGDAGVATLPAERLPPTGQWNWYADADAAGRVIVAVDSAFSSGAVGAVLRLLPDGSLDAGFGNAGVVTLDTPWHRVTAVASDRGGGVLVGGLVQQQGLARAAVLRLLEDGTPDGGFGDAGLALGMPNLEVRALAAGPDGSVAAVVRYNIVGLWMMRPGPMPADPRLPSSFRLLPMNPYAVNPAGVHWAADGASVLVVGGVTEGALTHASSVRLNVGSPTDAPEPPADSTPPRLADGFRLPAVLLEGTTHIRIPTDEAVEQLPGRQLATLSSAGADGRLGTPDDVDQVIAAVAAGRSIGIASQPLDRGIYRLRVSDAAVNEAGLAVDGDGDSQAGGEFVWDFAVAGGRSLDEAYGEGGLVARPAVYSADLSVAAKVAVLPDGGVYVYSPTQSSFVRLVSDGSVDHRAGVGGLIPLPMEFLVRNFRATADRAGRLWVVGVSVRDNSLIAARLLPDGSPDRSLGDGGVLRFPEGLSPTDDPILETVVDAVDAAYVAVRQRLPSPDSRYQTLLFRLSDAGVTEVTPFADNYGDPLSSLRTQMVTDPLGRVVFGRIDAGQLLLTRLDVEGGIDQSFGRGGYLTANLSAVPTPQQWSTNTLIARGDGSVRLVINRSDTSGAVHVIALDVQGRPDARFASGEKIVWPGTSFQLLKATEDGDAVVLSLATSDSNSPRLRHLRLDGDGLPDGSFGEGGVVTLTAPSGYLWRGVWGDAAAFRAVATPRNQTGLLGAVLHDVAVDRSGATVSRTQTVERFVEPNERFVSPQDGSFWAAQKVAGQTAVDRVVYRIIRYDAGGRLAESSGGGSPAETVIPGENVALLGPRWTPEGDGSSVWAGRRKTADGWQLFTFRLYSDGSLDSAWGEGGFAAWDIEAAEGATPSAMWTAGGGLISAVFEPSVFESTPALTLVRYDAAGVRDAEYGDGGSARFELPGVTAIARLETLSDGRVVAVGRHIDLTRASVLRVEVDGTVDNSAFAGGVQAVTLPEPPRRPPYAPPRPQRPFQVDVAAGGGLVFAADLDGSTSPHEILVLRLNASGAVDAGFGPEGFRVLQTRGSTSLVPNTTTHVALLAGGEVILAVRDQLHAHFIHLRSDGTQAPTPSALELWTGASPSETFGGFRAFIQDLVPLTEGLAVVGNRDAGKTHIEDFVARLTTATPAGAGEPSREYGQNPLNRFDANLDGLASPLDLLVVINVLNNRGRGEGEAVVDSYTRLPFADINGDGLVSPLDLLSLINQLNSRRRGGGEGEAVDLSSEAPLEADHAAEADAALAVLGDELSAAIDFAELDAQERRRRGGASPAI